MNANIYKWIFDSLIAEMLIVPAFLFWIIWRDAFIRKARLAKWPIFSGLSLVILAATFLTVAYGSFIEPRMIVVNRQNIILGSAKNSALRCLRCGAPRIMGIGAPIKIALLADFHAGLYVKKGFIERVVQKIEKENPDLILLAGDLVDSDGSEVEYLAPLGELAKKFPTYAILGNHDSGGGIGNADFYPAPERARAVAQWLTNQNVTVLENTGRTVKIGGREIYLAGAGEYLTHQDDVAVAFAHAPPNLPRLLLAHNPDTIYAAIKNHADLMLSAHTHGGQIRLPFYGMVGQPFTALGQYFDKGLFNFGETQLFITSGLGETGTRARLFNPPEIVILSVY